MKWRAGTCLGGVGLLLLCLPGAVTAAEAPAPPPAGPAEGYVVKKGDTLWGIARDRLKDPVLWPRIHEQNPFIADPNRIFPGDRLTLPGQEPPPAVVVEAPKPEAAPAPEPPKAEAPAPAPALPAPEPEVAKAPEPEVAKAPEPEAAPAPEPPKAEAPAPPPKIEAAGLPPLPPASPEAMACTPVLEPEQTAASAGIGSIVRSEDGRTLLSQEDRVVVGLDAGQSPSVGDKLAAVRTGLRVVHPRSGRNMGRVQQTLGVLEVTAVNARTAQARIVFACEAIGAGDRVAPFVTSPFPADQVAQPATRSVEGTILEAARSEQLTAQQQRIFLDVGSDQGVGPGDIFAVYRPSRPAANPVGGAPFAIPPERLGEAVVVRVTDVTATALLTLSPKESRAGDRVVLSRQIQP